MIGPGLPSLLEMSMPIEELTGIDLAFMTNGRIDRVPNEIARDVLRLRKEEADPCLEINITIRTLKAYGNKTVPNAAVPPPPILKIAITGLVTSPTTTRAPKV
jgi:hypothetical protein